MDETKGWITVAALVTVIVVSIVVAVNIGRTMTLLRAFEAGYCEVTLPGRRGLAWQKCDE